MGDGSVTEKLALVISPNENLTELLPHLEMILANGETVFRHACKLRLEGIVSSARTQRTVPAAS
jgi:hypothetical protein